MSEENELYDGAEELEENELIELIDDEGKIINFRLLDVTEYKGVKYTQRGNSRGRGCYFPPERGGRNARTDRGRSPFAGDFRFLSAGSRRGRRTRK